MRVHPEALDRSPKQTYDLAKLAAEFELFKRAYQQAEKNALVERWKNSDGTPKSFRLPS